MKGLARLVERPARWLAYLSALLILSMSLWITYDVVTRNLFGWASPWAFDLSEYSLVWMTFLAAPWILLRDGHVRVEILIDALGPRPQRAIGIAVSAVGLGNGPQGRRHQRQMIVLDEDRGGMIGKLLLDDRGKALVHALVVLPVDRAEHGPDVRLVAQGPESFVGEPFVVVTLLFRREPQAAQRVRRVVGRNAHPIAGVDDGAVGVADPWALQTPPRSRIRASRATATPPVVGDEPTVPSSLPKVLVRFPVGYDDHRPVGRRVWIDGCHSFSGEKRNRSAARRHAGQCPGCNPAAGCFTADG